MLKAKPSDDWERAVATAVNEFGGVDILVNNAGIINVATIEVVYLASDESSYSTGSEFVVDGGCTAGLGHKDFSAGDADAQPEWVQ